jgi:FtsZ-binding cell division protein ZapB
MTDGTTVVDDRTRRENAASHAVAAEAVADAYLERLLGKDADPNQVAAVPGSGVAGETDADGPARPDAEGETPASVAEEPGPEDARARALRRWRVPDAILSAVDAEVRDAWADEAIRLQTEVDGYTERMKALEQEVARLRGDDDATDASDGNQPEESGDEETDPAARIAEMFGDDAADAIVASAAKQARAAEARAEVLENENRSLKEQVQTTQQITMGILRSMAAKVLTPYNPTEEQAAEFDRRFTELATENPTVRDVETLMARAARDVLGPPPHERGMPTPPRTANRLASRYTPEEENDIAAMMYAAGKSKAEVDRALGKV